MNFNNLLLQIGSGIFAGQVFDFFGGLFLLSIGAAIFYSVASWRLRSTQGLLYTGRQVPLLLWAALAIGLLLSGAWLIYVGATVSKHGPIAWVLILLAVAVAAHWLWSRMNNLLAKIEPHAVPEPRSALPIERAESPGATRTFTLPLSSTRSKSRRSGVIFVVLGLGAFALTCWQARALWALGHGVRTSGIVVELNEAATGQSGDTFLFPVVQYTGQDGSVVRFHDRTGARPSPFKVGDPVLVRYVAGKPTTASIDRGLGNWEPLGALAIMGVMLTGLGLVALRSR